jgi:AcrR family transcriptional regulator
LNLQEVDVPQITPQAAAGETGWPEDGPDREDRQEDRPELRRERKKQRTRDALIEAAMALFAAKGYERATVREITDAVDVSERTFFRYFASKEDLVLSFVQDGLTGFAEALMARPAQEEPLTAACNAFGDSLRRRAGAEPAPSYLSVVGLIESTPVLLAAYLRYVHDHDDELTQILAQREGVDPVKDPRPRVLAAVIGALVFLANRDWRDGDDQSPEAMAAAFDAYADQVIPALTGRWSLTHPTGACRNP